MTTLLDIMQRNLQKTRDRIARQHEIILRLEKNKLPTDLAKEVLATLQTTYELRETRLAALETLRSMIKWGPEALSDNSDGSNAHAGGFHHG